MQQEADLATRLEERFLSNLLKSIGLAKPERNMRNDKARVLLATLDRVGISLRKYFALTQVVEELARKHALETVKSELSAKATADFDVKDCPAPHIGAYLSAARLLRFLVRMYVLHIFGRLSRAYSCLSLYRQHIKCLLYCGLVCIAGSVPSEAW